MKNCKQIAIEWGLSERTINDLCKKGKIDGAIKAGSFFVYKAKAFWKDIEHGYAQSFFEISEENTSKYFEDKAIWRCGVKYRGQQGQYPVVFLTFKDVKFGSWKATL